MPFTLPPEATANGWLITTLTIAPDVEQLTVRNARLNESTALDAVSQLTKTLLPLGFRILHYGAVPPFYSALFERRKTT